MPMRRRVFVRAGRLDSALFDAVARRHNPLLDRTLPALSVAANNSMLWALIGAALTSRGGRRGRRAALRGLGSIVVASTLVNQGLKCVVRRPRPSLRHVPAARRLMVQPTTTSFPSGHAASAAAFAVGAGSELPCAAPPLGALAAAVAYSRVYVGVHYPLDVALGAGVGAGVALLSRLQWPVLPAAADVAPASTTRSRSSRARWAAASRSWSTRTRAPRSRTRSAASRSGFARRR